MTYGVLIFSHSKGPCVDNRKRGILDYIIFYLMNLSYFRQRKKLIIVITTICCILTTHQTLYMGRLFKCLQPPCYLSIIIIILISDMRKLTFREVKKLTQGHTAGQWLNQDLNPSFLDSTTQQLFSFHHAVSPRKT